MPPNSFLAASRYQGELNIPVTKIELEHGVSPGVWLGSLADGLVSVYEEHSARLERGLSLETWEKMGVDEKALLIAVRRTNNAISNLQAEAEIAKTKKETK